MHTYEVNLRNSIFPSKTYILAGLELGSYVPQADAMTTEPKR
jgi:hypothetical protein